MLNEGIRQLQQLGFSEYEARVYVTLLQSHPLNGSELARHAHIPRPNAYSTLRKLERSGAVVRVETPNGTRYAPVPPDELIDKLNTRFGSSLSAAREALKTAEPLSEQAPVQSFAGYDNLLETARAVLQSAGHHVWVALWPEEAGRLSAPFAQAEARGLAITTLCLAGCPRECGGCRGDVYRYPVASAQGDERWLFLVVDDAELLAGAIDQQTAATAIRSRQSLLVRLTSAYIQQSLALGLLAEQGQIEPGLGALARHAPAPAEASLGAAHRLGLFAAGGGASSVSSQAPAEGSALPVSVTATDRKDGEP